MVLGDMHKPIFTIPDVNSDVATFLTILTSTSLASSPVEDLVAFVWFDLNCIYCGRSRGYILLVVVRGSIHVLSRNV